MGVIRRGFGIAGTVVGLGMAIVVSTPASAQAPPPPPLEGRFAALDVNRDGALDRQEVGPIVRRRFADLDRDGNGALDGEEVRAYALKMVQEGRSQPVPVAAPGIAGKAPTFVDVTAYLDETAALGQLAGIAVRVQRGGELLYEHGVGDLGPDTVVPVASGSKWMTAALLMTLVDEGVLALDGRLSTHLPYLNGTPAEVVTLGQALSHTAGFGSEHLLAQPFDMELAASARSLAGTELKSPPGTAFHYTGVAMQLAAAAAEAATGRTWSELFAERITGPLGMERTSFGHPMREITFAGNRNQIAESGVHTTLRDYCRFLEMIAGRGVFRGRRVLSETAITAMETDHTRGLGMSFVPPGARAGWGYGLGEWCEESDAEGRCTTVNSAGAFGAFPWVDREDNLAGVLLVVDSLGRLIERILATRDLVDAAVAVMDSHAAGQATPSAAQSVEGR